MFVALFSCAFHALSHVFIRVSPKCLHMCSYVMGVVSPTVHLRLHVCHPLYVYARIQRKQCPSERRGVQFLQLGFIERNTAEYNLSPIVSAPFRTPDRITNAPFSETINRSD